MPLRALPFFRRRPEAPGARSRGSSMKWTAAGLVAVLAALSTGCATAQDPGVLARRVSAQTTRQVLALHQQYGRGPFLASGSQCSIAWFAEGIASRGSPCARDPLYDYDRHTNIQTYVLEQQRLNNPRF